MCKNLAVEGRGSLVSGVFLILGWSQDSMGEIWQPGTQLSLTGCECVTQTSECATHVSDASLVVALILSSLSV